MAAEPVQRERRPGLFGPLLAAALLGGVVAAGGFLLLDRAGYLSFGPMAQDQQVPEPDPALAQELAALRSEVAELRQADSQAGTVDLAPLQEQIAALEQSIAELRQQPAGEPVDAAALQEVQTRLAQLEQTATSLAAAEPDAALEARLTELSGQVQALQTAGPAVADPAPQLAQLGARIDDLTNRLDTLEVRPPVDLSRLEATDAELRQQLDQLTQRLEGVATAEQVAGFEANAAEFRQQLGELAQRLEGAPTAEQVAALEASLTETTAQVELSAGLRPAVAAASLAAALQSGEPFVSELTALRALGSDEAALAALDPHAQEGLPTLSELRSRFEEQVAAVDLSTPVAGSNPLDRLLGSARGLVEVRPANPTGGTDPGAIVTRIRGALEAGDLATALAEWQTLPEDAKTPLGDWASTVEARIAAENLVARLRSEALSQLGTQG